MDLIDLDLVVAVADAGSITHGATAAHLSLASASTRIRGLERAFGVEVFRRDRRGVTVTRAGAVLVRHAREIRQALHRMQTELAEHADGRLAAVRVVANTAAVTSEFTPAVTAFVTAHPSARVDLCERPGRDVVAAVTEGHADLGIVADSVELGGLEVHPLRPDPLVVLTRPTDPLASREAVSYAELADRTFVALNDAAGFPLVTRPTYRLRLPTIDAVCHAVAAGAGTAILPRDSVAAYRAAGIVSATALTDWWAARQLVVCHSPEDELSATARALRDHLSAHLVGGAEGAVRQTSTV